MEGSRKKFDFFKDNTFSGREWSAPTFETASEIKETLGKMRIIGRRIYRMKMIGLNYNLTRDWICEMAYKNLSHLHEDERQELSDYKNILPDMEFLRYSEIDEPLLIEFDDGDVFEIDTPMDPEYRFSMNSIPWHIKAGTNLPNVDANKLFSVCIGKKIVDVEVTEGKGESASEIIFWLENNTGLCINPLFDYCEVSCIDRNKQCVTIPFRDLKDVLFNDEDLHTDEVLGFEGHGTMYFGKRGAEHVKEPYMTLSPSGKDTELYISVYDFDLLAWSMTIVLKKEFDEYGEYSLSYTEWKKVLEQAQKILGIISFDNLFDYIITQFKSGLWRMNNHCATFWKNKEKYKNQVCDILKWSESALGEDDALDIYGF